MSLRLDLLTHRHCHCHCFCCCPYCCYACSPPVVPFALPLLPFFLCGGLLTAEARAEEARIEEANKGNTSREEIDVMLRNELTQVSRHTRRAGAGPTASSARSGLDQRAHSSLRLQLPDTLCGCQVLRCYDEYTAASHVSTFAESKALAVSKKQQMRWRMCV